MPELSISINNTTQDTSVVELQQLLETSATSLEDAIELSGTLSQITSTLNKKNDGLKEFIKTHDFSRVETEHYVATQVPVEKIKITPVKMLKYLKDKSQTNLIDAVMDVKITEVRKYLGDIVVETLGKATNGTKNLYIKLKR